MESFKLDTSEIGSWNGIGWTLYGKDQVGSDGSYITTKWFIFFFLPLIPLGSYRVLVGESEPTALGVRTSYQMVKVEFNTKQVLKTYLVGWAIGAGIILVLVWISFKYY